MLSVYVVCWIFLQTFQTYFCIQANSVDPAQKEQSDLGPHCLQKWLLNHKQTTKQMPIVVIDALRVKVYFLIVQNFEHFGYLQSNLNNLNIFGSM